MRLQEADTRKSQTELHLRQCPKDIQALRAKIDASNHAFDSRRKALQEKEVKRKDLDTRLHAAEDRIVKYKTQQLQVKKTEEYQALNHEIETTEAEIARLEDEELQLLMELDQDQKALKEADAAHKQEVKDLSAQIVLVEQHEQALKQRLVQELEDVKSAAGAVEPRYLQAYERLRTQGKHAPFIAPVQDHKCGGCHLRVSNERMDAVRHANAPVFCDTCGRLIYLAP